MRIAVIGPTHPFKGGVSQHTTLLAHNLTGAGHDVDLVTWRRQYPRFLYPGQLYVDGDPEFPPFPRTRRRLHWARPWTWLSEARRLREHDVVVIAHVTPFQAPAYALMSRLLRSSDTAVTVICHNVLPHEPSKLDKPLARALLRQADSILTHSDSEQQLATGLVDTPVTTHPLPPFNPPVFTGERRWGPPSWRLLFFGLIRPYKGLDLLLRALARTDDRIRLRVAGEFWGGAEPYERLCHDLGLVNRVEIQAGYVPTERVACLFSDVDALVLPYRSATGSQGPWTAFELNVPVITTDAGNLADAVRPGLDGLVVPAFDVQALADAIDELYEPGRLDHLRANVRPVDSVAKWDSYLKALLSHAISSRDH